MHPLHSQLDLGSHREWRIDKIIGFPTQLNIGEGVNPNDHDDPLIDDKIQLATA
jgi:hypothetical protein